jgi:hypothetical protein
MEKPRPPDKTADRPAMHPDQTIRQSLELARLLFADVPAETRRVLNGLNASLRLSGKHYLSIAECAEILERLDGHNAAHMDLAGAHLRAAQPAAAEPHIRKAVEKGYPLAGLAHNYLAIVAAFAGDLAAVRDNLQHAVDGYTHAVIIRNINRFRNWFAAGGAGGDSPLRLLAENDFEGNMVPRQPELPARLGVPMNNTKER